MKWSILTISLFLLSVIALSQQPVKVNLLEYFDKIPVPPTSAKEAHSKCNCNPAGREGDCTADSLFKDFSDKLQQFQIEISTPAGSPQADLMKKMQDPEFQKKMENMSDDEKMKLAMEMQASSNALMAGPMKPEPQSVLDAMKELSTINEASANDLSNLGTNVQAAQQHQVDLDAKHKAVDDWKDQEIKKLPVHLVGEAGEEVDPKAVYDVNINALKKHLAIVDDELKETGKRWVDAKAKSKQLYAAYEKSLEKIHYAEDANNQISKTQLSTGQTLMIGSITNLMAKSQRAYVEAANWYDRLVQFQKQYTQSGEAK